MNPPPFDLISWIDSVAPKVEPPPKLQPQPRQANRPASGRVSPLERCIAYLLSPGFPASVEGEFGHGPLFRAACEARDGFGLERGECITAVSRYNEAKAHPPESEKQIHHKVDDAIKEYPSPSLKRLNADRPRVDIPGFGDEPITFIGEDGQPIGGRPGANGHPSGNGHASGNGHHGADGKPKVDPWPYDTIVHCADQDNYGYVREDNGGPKVLVFFDGPKGQATVWLPRTILTPTTGPAGAGGAAASTGAAAAVDYSALSDVDLGIIAADSLEPEEVEHLWQDRVHVGKIALFASEGGYGKSQTAARITSSVTTNSPFPDGTMPTVTGNVLILAAEDGQRDTVLPRLMAAGADLTKVKFITAKVTIPGKNGGSPLIHFASFQDLEYWRTILRRIGNVRLIIADPIPAYLGRGVNDHKNQEVRSVLEPFADLLDEERAALLAITHMGKSPDLKTPAHKILGSVAYSNLARTVHIIAADPDDKDRKFLCQVKNNLGPMQQALAFKIVEHHIPHGQKSIRTSRADFEDGALDVDATDLLNANRNPGKKRGPAPEKTKQLAAWLFDRLGRSPGYTLLASLFDEAGEAKFLGTKGEDGRWSGVKNLYRAKDFIPFLDGDRAGYTVDDLRAPLKAGGKEYVHWRLVYVGGSTTTAEVADDSPPF